MPDPVNFIGHIIRTMLPPRTPQERMLIGKGLSYVTFKLQSTLLKNKQRKIEFKLLCNMNERVLDVKEKYNKMCINALTHKKKMALTALFTKLPESQFPAVP